MSDTLTSFEALNVNGSAIDKSKGVIRGACAIKIGPAKGHDTWVDSKTLETAKSVLQKFSEGVKVKFRHSSPGTFTSVIEETFGLLKDFVIDGDKLRGDLYLLESLSSEIKAKAFEMAEKMANQFGLSIVFKGNNERIDGKNYLRCEEITSIDLTENPAATDGLFSAMKEKEIKYENGKDGTHAKNCMCESCEGKKEGYKKMEELTSLVTSLSQTVATLAQKFEKTAPVAATALAFTNADGTTTQLSAADVMQQLEASKKFVADAKKSVEDSERRSIIGQLQEEGRVVFNPDTNVAYKREELEKLDISFLKFAAKNSQVLPMVARATYTGTGTGPDKNFLGSDGKALQGTELTTKAWEADYGDINKLLNAPFGTPIGN